MKYKKFNYKFQLAENLEEQLINASILPDEVDAEYFNISDGCIFIKEGYAWDGASGPVFNTRNTLKASLIHDVLCQGMRIGIIEDTYRKSADKELRDQMIKSGVIKIRAWIWYFAVRIFGKKSATKGAYQGRDKVTEI